MGLLSVESTNADFSYVIFKNPLNNLKVEELKSGTLFGFFPKQNDVVNQQKYVMYFKDGLNSMSYRHDKDEQYDYGNSLKYTSPVIVINCISNYLDSALKKVHEKDTVSQNIFFVNLVKMSKSSFNVFNKLSKHFNVDVKADLKVTNHYQVTFTMNSTLNYMLNVLYVLFTMIAHHNNDEYEFNNDLIEKLINAIKTIDAPYYVRYIISSTVLTRFNFPNFKDSLQTSASYTYSLNNGNTQEQRQNYIKSQLAFDRPIVDIGCGEGAYVVKFSKLLKTQYYAIDIDEKLIDKLQANIKKRDIKNVTLYTTFETLVKDVREKHPDMTCDIILTEVIEHMTKDSAHSLIRQVVDNFKFNKLVITTPNFEFNQHYIMEDKFRHDDHHWEDTRDEFRTFVNECLPKESYPTIDYKFVDIGDSVNGVAFTQGIIVTMK